MLQTNPDNRPEAMDVLQDKLLRKVYVKYRKIADIENKKIMSFDDLQQYMLDICLENTCSYCGFKYLSKFEENKNNHICSSIEEVWDEIDNEDEKEFDESNEFICKKHKLGKNYLIT